MATVKNFGLAGVGSDVQFGKGGGRIIESAGNFSVFAADGSTPTQLNVALVPTVDSHAASKQYVDSVATGLDVKASVRAATASSADLTGFTYTAASDNETVGAAPWTLVSAPVFDGVTLVNGDRVLIKDATDARGNGIFTYDSTASTFVRATDADNSPNNEVSGGMFTFVEEGTQADNGYVMDSPNGIATLGTSSLSFSQFSGAGQITAGDGLTKTANTIDVVGSATIIANANNVEVNSSATAGQVLISGGTVGTAATYGALDLDNLASHTGTLDVASGGTNLSTIPANSLLVANTLDTLVAVTATDTAGNQLLQWNDTTNTFEFVLSSSLGTSYGKIKGGDSAIVAAADSSNEVITFNGTGINIVAADSTTGLDTVVFKLDVNDLTVGAATLAGTNKIAVWDGTDTLSYTFTNMLTDLNIVNGLAGNGIAVQTAANTYVNRSIVASTAAGFEGANVVNGDGIAGNPTIGLDIAGLTLDTTITGTDEIVVFNGTNNVKTTVAQLVSGGTVAWTSITDGTTTVFADTSSDLLTFTGTNGITIVASDNPETLTFDVDINGLVGTTPVTGATTIMVDAADGGTNTKRTFANILADLDIVTAAADGMLVRTAADTYASRILTPATTGLEGINIVNGDGVGGNPTLGLDINGLTLDTTILGTNELVMFNGTNNVKITIAELLADVNANQIAQGNSSVTVTDTGVGKVDITVDGGLVGTWNPANFDIAVQVQNAAGSAAAPAYSFSGDVDSGMYSKAANELCIAAGAKDIHCFRIQSGATGNEHLVTEAGDGEGRIVAEGTATNIDIRLVPQGTGQVILGSPGTDATVSSSNGTTGENLIVQAGNGTAGAGGNITITPGSGTTTNGIVCITDSGSNNVTCFEGVTTPVSYLTVTNSATGGSAPLGTAPEIKVTSTDTNVDIKFLPKGTGVLSVSGTTNYEANVTDDDDIPNRKFVIDQITTGAVASGSTTSKFSTVNDTGVLATTINIPLNALITRVIVNVTAPYAGTQGFDLGTVANATRVAADSTGPVDWQTVGTYIVETFESTGVAASDFALGITNATPGTGVATIRVEYVNA